MSKRVLFVAIATLLLGTTLLAEDGYRIVVNPANPVSSLSKSQVSKLFLDKAEWDGGMAVTPVDLPPASPIREAFSKEVLGLDPSAVADRWQKAPGGTPPPAMASDREVLAYVRLKRGAIGYVSLGADVIGVKVIAIGKAATVASSEPVAVGGSVPAPKKLRDMAAEYPPFAVKARIEGTVELAVVISAAGNVEKTRVVKSVPALDQAALAAVKQWKYTPTVINSEAVPVTMTVRVSFSLPPA